MKFPKINLIQEKTQCGCRLHGCTFFSAHTPILGFTLTYTYIYNIIYYIYIKFRSSFWGLWEF